MISILCLAGLLVNRADNADARLLEHIKAVQGNDITSYKYNRLDPIILIEKFFAKTKQYRAIATRHDKLTIHFLSAIHLIASAVESLFDFVYVFSKLQLERI